MKVLIVSFISIYFGCAFAGSPGGNCVVQWKNYNNQPSLPKGLMIGQSWDGKNVYVGRGTYTGIPSGGWTAVTQTAPGDLKLGDGFYMTFSGSRKHITSGIDYLKVVGDCCEFVAYTTTPSKPYVTVSSPDGYNFLITKHELSYDCPSDPSGCAYVTIGKFLPNLNEAWFSDNEGQEQSDQDGPFMALACDVAVAPPPA